VTLIRFTEIINRKHIMVLHYSSLAFFTLKKRKAAPGRLFHIFRLIRLRIFTLSRIQKVRSTIQKGKLHIPVLISMTCLTRPWRFLGVWGLIIGTFLLTTTTTFGIQQLHEEDRLREYARRQYTWPLLDSEYVPSTNGWRNLLHRRLQQIDQLSSYDGYKTTLSSALSPNYTEFGWGLTRAPTSHLVEALTAHLTSGMESTSPLEGYDGAIHTLDESNLRPLLVEIPVDLKRRVLQELQPLLEAWSGVALVPQTAYGLRVYRNTSKMHMHIDKFDTHVISAILHVGHDTNEPWPLVIEDFEGTTNQVNLEAGDVLLYESSKCWHGRPRRMNGKWYTSLFLHYYPRHFPVDLQELEWTIHHRVPPHWREESHDVNVDRFQMVDTFGLEPDCPDEWCALQDSKVVDGPGPEYGTVLTANGELQRLSLASTDSHEEL
jgi:hypothetical protein